MKRSEKLQGQSEVKAVLNLFARGSVNKKET
jgi:hypothetical protein